MAIEAVLLDAGGVLLLPRHDRAAAAFERAGASVHPEPERFDRGHYAGVAVWGRLMRTDWPAYFAAYARQAGVHDDLVGRAVEELAVEYASSDMWRRAHPDARRALAELVATHAVMVVSNSDGNAERLLREAGVCQVGPGPAAEVRGVIDSHVVGVSKPDPGIFAIALERLGVAPGRAVHVGDSLRSDVRGAQAAGIRPLHVDPYGFCGHFDHEHVVSVADVAGLLADG